MATSSPVRKRLTLLEDLSAFVVTKSSSVPDKPLHAGSQFVLVFDLRPYRLSGLLFHANNLKTSLNVFLNETEVKLSTNNNLVATQLLTDCALC